MSEDREKHWQAVYADRSRVQPSWHEDDPALSVELSELAGRGRQISVIDIGGGDSRYAARLLETGLTDVAVLDVSATALDGSRHRIGALGNRIEWIVSDVTEWKPTRQYDLWHDRAVFHFLTDPRDRAAYIERLSFCLRPGGHAIIATFAPDGPETCSGLPVVRYDPESLGQTLGNNFALVTKRYQKHQTPSGSTQSFQYSLFRKQK